jgi:response regulator of citrate/malate metabolism
MDINLSFTQRTKKLTSVYVIEDSQMDLNMMTDFLEKYPNLTVKGFPTGDACVKELVMSGFTPDLILVDYFLDSESAQSKDGLEILSKLREVSPNSDVIMLTSVDNPRIVDLARKKGALDYVVKGSASYERLDTIINKNFVLNTTPTIED